MQRTRLRDPIGRAVHHGADIGVGYARREVRQLGKLGRMAKKPSLLTADFSAGGTYRQETWYYRLWQHWPSRGANGARIWHGDSHRGPARQHSANTKSANFAQRIDSASGYCHATLPAHSGNEKSNQRPFAGADETDSISNQHRPRRARRRACFSRGITEEKHRRGCSRRDFTGATAIGPPDHSSRR